MVDRYGRGVDFLGKNDLKGLLKHIYKGAKLEFSTANGQTDCKGTIYVKVGPFNSESEALVMDSTPAVLSVGTRCMNEDYDFVWPRGEDPYFITPDGGILRCYVVGDVPYMDADVKADKSVAAPVIPALDSPQIRVTSEGEDSAVIAELQTQETQGVEASPLRTNTISIDKDATKEQKQEEKGKRRRKKQNSGTGHDDADVDD